MKEYGLSKNEYPDHGNLPYEIYVRKARRIEGRSVFTENNALLAKGIRRAPILRDSISVTEWFMDSHACTEHALPGSKPEGEVMLKNKTFLGQVSFGTLFPVDLDNFVVPVCLSSSHIGWGAIRLEPAWMNIGEAAAYAVVMALNKKTAPPAVNQDELLRLLARKRVMISFFNDVEGREYSVAWVEHPRCLLANPTLDPMDYAGAIFSRAGSREGGLTAVAFAKELGAGAGLATDRMDSRLVQLGIWPEALITRGEASQLIFEVLSIV